MNLATLIEELVPSGWPTMILVSARVIGVMIMAPMWSMPVLPANTRVAAAVLLTLSLLPAAPTADVPDAVLSIPIPLAIEFLIGMSIGLATSVFIHGVALASEIVSVQMGLSIAGALAPSVGVTGPGLGAVQGIMAVAIYFIFGGHLMLIQGLADSLHIVPPGVGTLSEFGMRRVVEVGGTAFVTAVKIAGPLMVAMTLANAVLALLNRAVPQINAMMVAFPITIGLGFVVFVAALPFIMSAMREWVLAIPQDVRHVTDGFAIQ